MSIRREWADALDQIAAQRRDRAEREADATQAQAEHRRRLIEESLGAMFPHAATLDPENLPTTDTTTADGTDWAADLMQQIHTDSKEN